MQTFELGKAPWEVEDNTSTQPMTFEAGKAPWETEQPSVDLGSMSLVGALKGTQQTPNPFVSSTPKEEPIMDLIGQRDIIGTQNDESTRVKTVQEVRSNIENLYSRYSDIPKQVASYFGDSEAKTELQVSSKALEDNILKELTARGYSSQFRDGKLYVAEDDGTETEVPDSTFLQQLLRSKGEMTGAIGGAIGGGRLGFNIGSKVGPVGAAVGTALGATIGGGIGAAGGSGADALLSNFELVNKVNDDVIYAKMADAGIADVIMAPIGAAVAKGVVGAAKVSGKAMQGIFDFVYDSNLDGAYKLALDQAGVTEAQAKEIVSNVENLVGPMRGSPKEKVLQALTQTYKGGEGIVQAANILDPKASANMASQVFQRAEDVLAKTQELSADNIQAIFKQNIDGYIDNVKNYYSTVKEAPQQFTKDYSFDFDSFGIEPIIDEIGKKVENPAIKQRFVDTLTRIEQASEGRGFNDLIDLRQAINDIKYNTSKIKYTDQQALDKALKSIDDEITSAAKTHIPEYDTWLKSFDNAKLEYAKMKDLESNVLYKSLTRPGLTEDTVVKTFARYIGAGDNTFYQVMEKLPKNVQDRVEGSVLNMLTEKFAAGTVGGNRAISFPLLSKELKKVSWQSPQTKQVVRTINRMADVFQNDVNLARVSGNIEVPRFQSYLTTDPIVRLKYEVASTIFNHIKQFKPGNEADALALVKHTGKLLENPLHSKTINDLMKARPMERREFRQKLDFSPDLSRIQQAYIERQQAMKQMFGKEAPARLVWNADPEKLARIQNPTPTTLPSGQGLYATQRGTVGVNPSEIALSDRSDDLITEFIWKNSNAKNDDIVSKALQYMDDNRYMNIMKTASSKLVKNNIEANAKVVANSIRAEAGILRKRIEKDFGLKMPKEEAEKLVWLKYKEVMENCNGK